MRKEELEEVDEGKYEVQVTGNRVEKREGVGHQGNGAEKDNEEEAN